MSSLKIAMHSPTKQKKEREKYVYSIVILLRKFPGGKDFENLSTFIHFLKKYIIEIIPKSKGINNLVSQCTKEQHQKKKKA